MRHLKRRREVTRCLALKTMYSTSSEAWLVHESKSSRLSEDRNIARAFLALAYVIIGF